MSIKRDIERVADDVYEEVKSIKESIDSLDDSLRSRADGGHTILGAIEKQTEAILRLGDILESFVEKGEEDGSK